jgi:putative flippase GtrA
MEYMLKNAKHLKTVVDLFKYSAIAAIGLVLDFGSLVFFKQIVGLYYLIAVALSFILGLIVTYTLSNMFVFGEPKGSKTKVFILFGLVGVVGLGILSLLEWLFTSKIGINYIISKALATIFVFLWNFFARRTLYKDTPIEELPYEL